MKKIIGMILLILFSSCSIILVSKSTGTTVNQKLEEEVSPEVDADFSLFSKKKDSINRNKRDSIR